MSTRYPYLSSGFIEMYADNDEMLARANNLQAAKVPEISDELQIAMSLHPDLKCAIYADPMRLIEAFNRSPKMLAFLCMSKGAAAAHRLKMQGITNLSPDEIFD